MMQQRLTRRKVLAAALGSAGAWAFWRARGLLPGGTGEPRIAPSHEPLVRKTVAMGTEVSITIADDDVAGAEQAATAAFEELRRLESLLSLYQPQSQISILNRDGVLPEAHADVIAVLEAALAMSKKSQGAFDPTVQPLWRVHAESARLGRLPSDQELESARRKVDWRQVEIEGSRVRFTRPGMAVTLNGIAQGFATDRVRAVLSDRGVGRALVDVGELGSLGRKPTGAPWTAGIQHPRVSEAYVALATLDDRCLSTSGDYATTFGPDHRRHHLFDPSTGQSPGEFASVSVAAPTSTQADALSTAVFVLGLEKGTELIHGTRGADALFVLKDGSARSTHGFPSVDSPG